MPPHVTTGPTVDAGGPIVFDPNEAPSSSLPSSTPNAPPAKVVTCPAPQSTTPAVLSMRWSATAPVGVSGSTPSVHAKIVQPDCTVSVATQQIATQPAATWTTFLQKKDTTPGSCKEQLGYATLTAQSYSYPIIRLASHPSDPKLFLLAWSRKLSAEGTLGFTMQQIDWATGSELRIASTYVKGKPQTFPAPSAYPSSITINGCDVTLVGRGSFSGASGTPTDEWVATYPAFVTAQRQPPSGATSAAYR